MDSTGQLSIFSQLMTLPGALGAQGSDESYRSMAEAIADKLGLVFFRDLT